MLGLDNVTVRYPNRVTALEAASAEFPRGQFIVLLGPSGAGKSTMLRCLNGLVRPAAGKVHAEQGGDILASTAALRRHRQRTGMIFQQHHLIGRLTALQNVLTGRLSFHGTLRSLLPLPTADKLVALEALDRVGLADRALHRADQLSGGQQQRVGIARALAQRPAAILADEPVASLDPATADKVLALLHRICCEDGITAVVSLHQVELARRYGDRIYGLADGRVVFEGTGETLDGSALERIYGATPKSSHQPGHSLPPLKMAKTA